MSIDKFGRIKKRSRTSKNLNLNAYGQFDLDNHRLINLSQPILDNEAATKKYIDDRISGLKKEINETSLSLNNKIYDAKGKEIRNLHKPTEGDSAAHKYYVDYYIQKLLRRIKNIEQINHIKPNENDLFLIEKKNEQAPSSSGASQTGKTQLPKT